MNTQHPDPDRARKPYPTDVSDEEWALVAPYLTLLPEDALPRRYPLREVFNAARWIVRAGAPWRLLPTNFPPWPIVYDCLRLSITRPSAGWPQAALKR
jgi:transposase